ncbi:unnamed protein product [Tuber aestivum]|uniref:Uncharacterized protein n=1 Tax=Tuber aestivum TaxID=59557 RepID=A0A292PHV7_9PEZI|nr:unnamed protein product [Tuber aestivum]
MFRRLNTLSLSSNGIPAAGVVRAPTANIGPSASTRYPVAYLPTSIYPPIFTADRQYEAESHVEPADIHDVDLDRGPDPSKHDVILMDTMCAADQAGGALGVSTSRASEVLRLNKLFRSGQDRLHLWGPS